MREQPSSFRLGVFAWESDLLDADQLASGVAKWAEAPETSLVGHLIADGSLTDNDIKLLKTLWAERTADDQLDSTRAEKSQGKQFELSENRADFADSSTPLTASHRFDLVNTLARGGLGKVSVAIDRSLNRRVAIKEMLPDQSDRTESRLRFFREAEITGQLEHPAVVPIHHVGFTAEGVPFYSMRLIEGQTIRDLARELISSEPSANRFNSLEFRRLLNSFITVCHAVAHAHSRQIIHRDIKPANIIVGKTGETMLVDWGLAKTIKLKNADENYRQQIDACGTGSEDRSEEGDFDVDLSAQGSIIGTPAYMSPEQAAGSGHTGPASDIYSLGATLHFLLTGRPPVQADSPGAILTAARLGKRTTPREVCTTVPLALDAICQKAMAFDPADRYSNPIQITEDIERWLADEPVSVWRDSASVRWRRWIRKYRALSMAVSITILASLLGLTVFSAMMARHNHQLQIANENEQAARAIADQQGALALETLRSVVGDIQIKLQHIPAAQRVRQGLLETSLVGLEKVAVNLANSTEVDMCTLLAHRELGDLFLEIGNVGDYQGVERAKMEFQAAHSIAQVLVDAYPLDIEAGRQLALTLQRLADVESRIGSATVAMEQRVLALAMLEQLHGIDPNNEQVIRSIGVAHNLLGDLYIQLSEYKKAGDHFLEALRIREDQASRSVHFPESDRDLVVSLNKVAGHYSRIGDDNAAEEMFSRSLLATNALVDANPGDFNALRDLSVVHYRLGNHWLKQREMEKAIEHHEASQALDLARLALDPENLLAQRDVLESTMQLADTLRRAGHREVAIQRSHEAIELGDRVLLTNPNDRRAMRYLAYVLGDLGTMLCEVEDGEANSSEYLQLFERCLALMTQAAKLDSENPRGQYDIAYGKIKLSRGFLAAGQPADALAHLGQALSIQRNRCGQQPENLEAQNELVETLLLKAEVCQKLQQNELVHDLFAEAQEITDRLTVEAPTSVAYKDSQINVLYNFGRQLKACREFEIATIKFETALQLATNLLQSGDATETANQWIEKLNRGLEELRH